MNINHPQTIDDNISKAQLSRPNGIGGVWCLRSKMPATLQIYQRKNARSTRELALLRAGSLSSLFPLINLLADPPNPNHHSIISSVVDTVSVVELPRHFLPPNTGPVEAVTLWWWDPGCEKPRFSALCSEKYAWGAKCISSHMTQFDNFFPLSEICFDLLQLKQMKNPPF